MPHKEDDANSLLKSLYFERIGRQFNTPATEKNTTSFTIKTHDDNTCSTTQHHELRITERPGVNLGSHTWNGAVILSNYLQQHASEICTDKRIIELGSGTGLTGLTAAKLGAKRVLVTDVAPVVPLLKWNIEQNGFNENDVSADELNWLQFDQFPFKTTSFDVILGADIVYNNNTELFNALLHVIDQLFKASNDKAVMYLCYRRRDPVEAYFFSNLEEPLSFKCEQVYQEVDQVTGKEQTIFRISRRVDSRV